MSGEKNVTELLQKFGGTFDLVFGLLKANGKLQQTALIEKYLPQVKEISAKLVEVFGDGFQWSDFLKLSGIVKPLMLLANEINGIEGEQKKEFVKEAFMLAYRTYDKGPSGNENNIKIPYLPQFIEQKVEEIVVPLIVDFAVDTLFAELTATKQL